MSELLCTAALRKEADGHQTAFSDDRRRKALFYSCADEIDRLREAVRKYGKHEPLCAMVGGYGYCNCGLYDYYPPQGT